jgi:hypothetical protein
MPDPHCRPRRHRLPCRIHTLSLDLRRRAPFRAGSAWIVRRRRLLPRIRVSPRHRPPSARQVSPRGSCRAGSAWTPVFRVVRPLSSAQHHSVRARPVLLGSARLQLASSLVRTYPAQIVGQIRSKLTRFRSLRSGASIIHRSASFVRHIN